MQEMSPKGLGAPAPVCEKDGYVLHPDLLNPRLLEAQYAVRGELYLKAEELKKSREIIYTNGTPGATLCPPHAPAPTLLSQAAVVDTLVRPMQGIHALLKRGTQQFGKAPGCASIMLHDHDMGVE